MAFETHIIALNWVRGDYSVASSIIGYIDLGKLYKEKRLFDVTNEMTYMDEACVISRRDFPNYFCEEDFEGAVRVRLWFESLSSDVQFLIVHVAEWESGMN